MKRYLRRRFAGLRAGLIAALLLGMYGTDSMAAEILPDQAIPVAEDIPEPVSDPALAPMTIPAQEPTPAPPPTPAREMPRISRSPAPIRSLTPLQVEEPPMVQEAAVPEPVDPTSEIIQERYANGTVKTERSVRQDAQGNFVLHGDWRSFDQKGVLIAEGQYENNQRHGTWRRFFRGDEAELFKTAPYSEFKSPYISQAIFQNGKLHGAWIIVDSKHRKISEIEFANGNRHGRAQWWHASGQLAHELHFANGQINGEARVFDANGALVRKEIYVDSRRVGSITDNYESGQKKQQAEYLFAPYVLKTSDDWWNAKLAEFATVGKEERHGHFVTWHPNGNKQRQGEYDHGLPVGKMTWWYENGQKSVEGSYANGKPVGEWNWWHDNGQKSIAGAFRDGGPDGQWMWWKPDGRLTQKVDLSKGKDVAQARQPSLGIPEVEGTLRNFNSLKSNSR